MLGPLKKFFLFQCGDLWGNLRIGKQSAQRSGQEEATKRRRPVIQLSLGSNEASTFGGCNLGPAMTVVVRNLLLVYLMLLVSS